MQALIAPLKELAEYDEIRKVTRQGKGTEIGRAHV